MASTFLPISLNVRINKAEKVVLPTPPLPLTANFIAYPFFHARLAYLRATINRFDEYNKQSVISKAKGFCELILVKRLRMVVAFSKYYQRIDLSGTYRYIAVTFQTHKPKYRATRRSNCEHMRTVSSQRA
jgi:hypothetical protein